jgi:hypothetical protein
MRGRGLGPRVAAGTARGSTGRVPVAGPGSSFLLPGPGPRSGEAGREYGDLGFPGDSRLGRTGVTQVNEFADSPRVTAERMVDPSIGHTTGTALAMPTTVDLSFTSSRSALCRRTSVPVEMWPAIHAHPQQSGALAALMAAHATSLALAGP